MWVKQEQNIETGELASPAQTRFAKFLIEQWKKQDKPLTARQAGLIISAFKGVE